MKTNRKEDILHHMDGKLHPCPFCGGKFYLHHETYTNSRGHEVQGYWWESDCEIDCLYYDIHEEPWHIGAGDVNISSGYVGEYGDRWNRHFEEVE